MTHMDAHLILNEMGRQAIGAEALTAVDTSSFVSLGEQLMERGYNTVCESLGSVLGRMFTAVRPYNATLKIINSVENGMYTNRMRKISYYTRWNDYAGFVNTDLKTNFATGFDNNNNGDKATPGMWVQNKPIPLEIDFGGSSVWQTSTTIYEHQLKNAFRNEDEFIRFVDGIMVKKANEIELAKEQFNRMLLLNTITNRFIMSENNAGKWDESLYGTTPGYVGNDMGINLAAVFNNKYGTTYSSKEILTKHAGEFLKLFVSTFKLYSNYLTHPTVDYHVFPMAKEDKGLAKDERHVLTRHTPKDKQRAILLDPVFLESKTEVMPGIFNPEYLEIGATETVDYWQANSNSPVKYIGSNETVPARYCINYAEDYNIIVLGYLYDVDGMFVDYQLDTAMSTPVEARKLYRNLWWSFARNAINDMTENGIVFYMADSIGAKAKTKKK